MLLPALASALAELSGLSAWSVRRADRGTPSTSTVPGGLGVSAGSTPVITSTPAAMGNPSSQPAAPTTGRCPYTPKVGTGSRPSGSGPRPRPGGTSSPASAHPSPRPARQWPRPPSPVRPFGSGRPAGTGWSRAGGGGPQSPTSQPGRRGVRNRPPATSACTCWHGPVPGPPAARDDPPPQRRGRGPR